MDYTKVPRSLIYRERRSLEEFGVYEKDSITQPFVEELLKFGSDEYPDIEKNALWCMNNAFYICTMFFLERDPRPRIRQYKKIATPKIKERYISDKYWSAVLSIVFLLLERTMGTLTKFQDEARQHLLMIIANDNNNDCTKMFNRFCKKLKDDTAIPPKIPNSMFAPRIIDKETVEDVIDDDYYDWEEFTDEMRERNVREIVKTFGTTEEEKHNVVEILRWALHDLYKDTDKEDNMLDEIDEGIRSKFNSDGNQAPEESKEKTVSERTLYSTNYKSRIEELEERKKELEEQVAYYHNMEKGIALGLNQGQSSLFVKSLANAFDFTYTNMKKELAPLAHGLFGWGESKLAKHMSTPCEKTERDELANLFKDVCPKLYDTIMNWGKVPLKETPEETPLY